MTARSLAPLTVCFGLVMSISVVLVLGGGGGGFLGCKNSPDGLKRDCSLLELEFVPELRLEARCLSSLTRISETNLFLNLMLTDGECTSIISGPAWSWTGNQEFLQIGIKHVRPGVPYSVQRSLSSRIFHDGHVTEVSPPLWFCGNN